jgi:hypothetical protein
MTSRSAPWRHLDGDRADGGTPVRALAGDLVSTGLASGRRVIGRLAGTAGDAGGADAAASRRERTQVFAARLAAGLGILAGWCSATSPTG